MLVIKLGSKNAEPETREKGLQVVRGAWVSRKEDNQEPAHLWSIPPSHPR